MAAVSFAGASQLWLESKAGKGRFDTRLLVAGRGKLLCKGGAEGIEVVGMLGENLGLAVKIADGATRAVKAVVVALLNDLGMLERADLEDLAPNQVKTREGDVVGDVRVRL